MRKGPNDSATKFKVGTKKIGNDIARKKVDKAKEKIYIIYDFLELFEKILLKSNSNNSNEIKPKIIKPTGKAT